MTSASSSSPVGDLLLLRPGEHGAGRRPCCVKRNDSVASMIAPGEREAEGKAERAARGVDARGLADPLLRDGREGVVVELRDQQAEARSRRSTSGTARSQPGVGPRYDRHQHQDPSGQQREARADDAARAPVPRLACRRRWRRRTSSARAARARGRPASRRTRAPSAGRSGARSSRRRGRSAAASAARSRAGSTRRGTGPGRSAPACPPACGGRATRRAHDRDDADGEERADGLAALLPHEDAEHDPAHAEDREDRRRRRRARGAGVRARRWTSLMPDEDDRDDDDLAAGTPTRQDR